MSRNGQVQDHTHPDDTVRVVRAMHLMGINIKTVTQVTGVSRDTAHRWYTRARWRVRMDAGEPTRSDFNRAAEMIVQWAVEKIKSHERART